MPLKTLNDLIDLISINLIYLKFIVSYMQEIFFVDKNRGNLLIFLNF
jgi:hypothetical protein